MNTPSNIVLDAKVAIENIINGTLKLSSVRHIKRNSAKNGSDISKQPIASFIMSCSKNWLAE